MKDLYIIRKFVYANSAEEAYKKDKKTKVSEVYIDNEFLKHKIEKLIDKKIYSKWNTTNHKKEKE